MAYQESMGSKYLAGRKEGDIDAPTISDAKQRQIIINWNRSELEDNYLRLRDEHSELKKKTHKQDDKMKQMATKLLRLVKDRKNLAEGGGVDLESRDRIEELKASVSLLEKQNSQLKNRLMVAKQQLSVHGKKSTPYDHIRSRINMGSPKKSPSPSYQRIREQLRVQGSPTSPRYGHSLLEEARLEKHELEDQLAGLQEQLQEYERNTKYLQEQIQQKDIEHEEDMQKIRQQFSGTQRSAIQENVELIKLQRELKEKVNQLQTLQGKYQNLDELVQKVKTSHSQVLEEMDQLCKKLKEEQVRNTDLQNQLKHGDISQQTLAQKEEYITDLKAEIQLLKEAHEKLLHSTFDAEREREHRSKEKQYQIRIAQLEATIKSDVTEKNVVLDKLTSERDKTDYSQKEFRELQVKYFEIKEKYEDLTEKLKFFTSESITDFEEIQEALMLIKTKKERASQDLNFLEKVDDDMNKDLRKEIQELQSSHADTINELEKTRSMLILQHNINRDYQKEVDKTTRKMDELKRECDTRVQEYAQLLDVRAERIKKLESQLRDVAYGTKQFKIKVDDDMESIQDEDDAAAKLERGQNIFEIHLGKINIIKDNLGVFEGVEPATFISYEFFEYELQTTPVMHGMRPDFNHTSQYIVQVDDFFLHYLQKENMMLEFHQAFGTEYRTIAKASINFKELLDRSHGRLHSTVSLFHVDNDKETVSVEYWLRLRVPMEQALRLYKERTKALGYITSNDLDQLENPNAKTLKDSGINELKITIVRCSNLKQGRSDVQPCCYCVYKFFDFADHDTDIVQNSNSPQFHDTRSFPVPMTEELDNYLKNTNLDVYVFDDLETEPTAYVGIAKIPLISLTQDKPLKGKFQMKDRSGKESGVMELALEWLYTYLPATAKKVRTYPQPISTIVDHDSVYIPSNRSKMQPMIPSGKLLEPHTVAAEMDVSSGNLEPTYDHKLHGSSVYIEKGADSGIRPSTKNWKADTKSAKSSPKLPEEKLEPELDESKMKTMSVDELASVYRGNDSRKNTDEETGNDSDQVFLEEELRRTVEAPSPAALQKASDTMFEEQLSENTDDGDIVMPGTSRISKEIPSDEGSLASDDTEDDVIIASSINKKPRAQSLQTSTSSIVVIINSLTLFQDADLLGMDNIRQLFVSYKFLDYDPEELETPMSLPKPKGNKPISFNFKKVFHIDEEEHETSRQYLMHLLMPDHPNEGRLFFTVVSDPMDNEEEDCEDVGIAYVDLIQILKEGKDFVDEDIEVYDLLGSDGDVIGVLSVTVEALSALRSLYE